MKTMVAVLLAFTTAATLHAQPFVRDANVISAGIGLGSALGGFGYGSSTPAFSVQYERGVWDIAGPGVISLGGYAGIKSFSYSFQYTSKYTYNQKWNYTVVGVRSAYHYNGIKSDKFDVYGGLMLQYNIVSYSYDDNNPTGVRYNNAGYGSGIGLSVYFGGRYFFTKSLAAMAELGYGVSYLNVGIAFKL